jgi:hypothetical protein
VWGMLFNQFEGVANGWESRAFFLTDTWLQCIRTIRLYVLQTT